MSRSGLRTSYIRLHMIGASQRYILKHVEQNPDQEYYANHREQNFHPFVCQPVSTLVFCPATCANAALALNQASSVKWAFCAQGALDGQQVVRPAS